MRNAKLPTDEEWIRDHHYSEGTFDALRKLHAENVATFRLTVPIFIARQIMRHRQFSYQELSRRYVDDKRVPLEFWEPSVGSNTSWLQRYERDARLLYQSIKSTGVPPEIARSVLPLSLYTEFWMQGDAPAWENYFKLRLDPHTQKEHRELAQAMLDLLKEHQPELWEKVKP